MSEIRLSCRCVAARGDEGFRIEAEAFLCRRDHKRGYVVSVEEERLARHVDEEWDRAEADYLEQR